MDRAEIRFNIAGITFTHLHIKKYRLLAGQIGDLLITGKIDHQLAVQISRLKESNTSSANLYCVFSCVLHDFEKNEFHLSGIHPRYMDYLPKESN